MTDSQIIAIAITVLAILAGTLVNNSRISDVSTGLNRRIDDTRDVLRAEMQALEARMDNRFNAIERKLDEFLRIVGDHESRMTALEQRPR
jgi:low affinity Fe/Cu permease